jgi:hypothetical protein
LIARVLWVVLAMAGLALPVVGLVGLAYRGRLRLLAGALATEAFSAWLFLLGLFAGYPASGQAAATHSPGELLWIAPTLYVVVGYVTFAAFGVAYAFWQAKSWLRLLSVPLWALFATVWTAVMSLLLGKASWLLARVCWWYLDPETGSCKLYS